MRSSLVFVPVAMATAALAAPRIDAEPSSSSTKPAASRTTSTSDQPFRYVPAQLPTLLAMDNGPDPTPAAIFNGLASEATASWTTIITSIIIGEGGPDSWFPFSWGPWMLPPLADITCSVTSTSVPNWDSPDFPWIIPPRNHIRTEAPTPTSTTPLPQWTESAPGSWGVRPRDGVTCVGTSSTSTFTPVPIWGGGGTSFFWGLPPRDEQVSTEPPISTPTAAPLDWSTVFVTVVSTATFASKGPGCFMSASAFQSLGEGQTAAVGRQLDVTTITEVETVVVTDTVVSSQASEPNTSSSSMSSPTETDSEPLLLITSHQAISTLSATKGPDLVTASSAWVDGLPPPIPFDSIIIKTLTLDIPDHGTNVADTSTWFGPWPSSTEMPFVTSPIIIQTTPTTFLTLSKTTSDITASITSSSSIKCNEEYCGEDGTSYCFYWAGVTTMGQHGPEPGETRVPMGVCSVGAVPTTSVVDPV